MHEVVTLQFGEQSNYVGTHFWNTQESYFTYNGEQESPVDHHRLFRPGIGSDGSETFTPRALIYDMKRNFGSLRRDNALYGMGDEEQSQWQGVTNTIREPHIEPSEYQKQLDAGTTTRPHSSSIRYWSDYNRIFYHPRSFIQLHDGDINPSLRSLERIETGEELFSYLDRDGALLDRDLRPLLEECDQLQGVQIISGVDDAWGGFAARYIDAMRGELGKSSLLCWALEDGSRKEAAKQNMCTANVAQSTLQIASAASIFVPLTSSPSTRPSYLSRFESDVKWHSSALQALAIDSATLFTRLKEPGGGMRSLDHCADAISNGGKRRIAHVELELRDGELSLGERQPAGDSRINGHAHPQKDESDTVVTLMPQAAARNRGSRRRVRSRKIYAQATTARGDWDRVAFTSRVNASTGSPVRSASAQTAELSFTVLDSFPDFLTFGSVDRVAQKVAVAASMSTDSIVADRIRDLAETAPAAMVAVDDRESLRDGLFGLRDEYLSGPEAESDEDDD